VWHCASARPVRSLRWPCPLCGGPPVYWRHGGLPGKVCIVPFERVSCHNRMRTFATALQRALRHMLPPVCCHCMRDHHAPHSPWHAAYELSISDGACALLSTLSHKVNPTTLLIQRPKRLDAPTHAGPLLPIDAHVVEPQLLVAAPSCPVQSKSVVRVATHRAAYTPSCGCHGRSNIACGSHALAKRLCVAMQPLRVARALKRAMALVAM